jgi:hypothetical protein
MGRAGKAELLISTLFRLVIFLTLKTFNTLTENEKVDVSVVDLFQRDCLLNRVMSGEEWLDLGTCRHGRAKWVL